MNFTRNGRRVIDPTWRTIPGYGGIYEISTMGEIRCWRKRNNRGLADEPWLMKTYPIKSSKARGCARKWPSIHLTDANGDRHIHTVHILMRDVWMQGKRPGMVVYHKNGDVTDSCLHNLAYISSSKLGKKSGGTGSRKPVVKVNQEGEVVACYTSAHDAARKNYMSSEAILQRCRNQIKDPYRLTGYTFQFDL